MDHGSSHYLLQKFPQIPSPSSIAATVGLPEPTSCLLTPRLFHLAADRNAAYCMLCLSIRHRCYHCYSMCVGMRRCEFYCLTIADPAPLPCEEALYIYPVGNWIPPFAGVHFLLLLLLLIYYRINWSYSVVSVPRRTTGVSTNGNL